MVTASKAICSSCELQQVAHKICCDKRVLILGHYNSWLMSSRNFSYIVYASTTQGGCSHIQDQKVSCRLRSLAEIQTTNAVCKWLPISNCLRGRFLWDYVALLRCASVPVHMVTLMDYSGWNPLSHTELQLHWDWVIEARNFAEQVAYLGRKDWFTIAWGLDYY